MTSSLADITGRTRVAVHLACPAAHLRTPSLVNARCRELGIDGVLVPWQVPPDLLAAQIDALRGVDSLAGMAVTLPHKTAAAALCDELVGDALSLGVCNVIRRLDDGTLIGHLHDGDGFVDGLRHRGIDPKAKRALMIGAGGAATAVASALLREGVAELVIANRTPARAADLVARLQRVHPGRTVRAGDADPTGFDLIVNGTSLGMHADDPLPLDPSRLAPGMVVAEMIMSLDTTALLGRAQAAGCATHRGIHMLEAQVDWLVRRLFQESPVQA